MVDKKAVDVFNILRERIDGEFLYGNNSYTPLYIWCVRGEKEPKKILIVEYHPATNYWDIMVDGSESDYVRMSFPHKGTAESIVSQILAVWQ